MIITNVPWQFQTLRKHDQSEDTVNNFKHLITAFPSSSDKESNDVIAFIFHLNNFILCALQFRSILSIFPIFSQNSHIILDKYILLISHLRRLIVSCRIFLNRENQFFLYFHFLYVYCSTYSLLSIQKKQKNQTITSKLWFVLPKEYYQEYSRRNCSHV